MSSHFLVGLLLGVFVGLPSGILVEKNVPPDSLSQKPSTSAHVTEDQDSKEDTIIQHCSDMDSFDAKRGACPWVD